MKRIALFLLTLSIFSIPRFAYAQNMRATTVAACGAQGYDAGQPRDVVQDVSGKLCTGGGGSTSNQGTPGSISAGWPIVSGEPADTTGTFTNATQSTAIATPSADGYQTATITIKGTYATATATFLASDDGGTTYYPIQCARTDGSVAELGYTSLTNVSRAWYCPIHGFDSVEVLSSAVATGTVNVRISISAFPTAFGGLEAGVPTDKNGTQADFTLPTLVVSSQQKPNGATQAGASAAASNSINTATMTAQSGKTNYVCQVTFTADGSTTGLAVAPTITGLLGGTRTFAFNFPAGVAVGAPSLVMNFSPCLPASATNTAISAILPAGGTGNTQASADIEGYFQ